jgi:hypothetical protein
VIAFSLYVRLCFSCYAFLPFSLISMYVCLSFSLCIMLHVSRSICITFSLSPFPRSQFLSLRHCSPFSSSLILSWSIALFLSPSLCISSVYLHVISRFSLYSLLLSSSLSRSLSLSRSFVLSSSDYSRDRFLSLCPSLFLLLCLSSLLPHLHVCLSVVLSVYHATCLPLYMYNILSFPLSSFSIPLITSLFPIL